MKKRKHKSTFIKFDYYGAGSSNVTITESSYKNPEFSTNINIYAIERVSPIATRKLAIQQPDGSCCNKTCTFFIVTANSGNRYFAPAYEYSKFINYE
jgi:hypothetical protein